MPPALRVAPSLETKLRALGESAAHDVSCAGGDASPLEGYIYPAALPSGRRVPMLKVLQQGGCERDCAYCAERLGGERHGELGFTPDELARLLVDLHRRGQVQGLFLSSGIRGGPVRSMDRMLATAEILRRQLGFRGYLHLKILPGCGADQVEQAMRLATRVSVNLEAPTAERLAQLAPTKALHKQILAPMRQVALAEAEGRFRRGGQTTQLVVGAGGETDREIGRAAAWLYRQLNLARVYYSGFRPVQGTPLSDRPAAPPRRQHRLYQLDFLLRSYGFDLEEIAFDASGQLPLDVDPKTMAARLHPERFPLEVNSASLEELLRVPGIGPTSGRRLLQLRRGGAIRSVDALRACCAAWRNAAPYLLLDGRRAAGDQLDLFAGR
jgi:predicted DNA-binding helix-hairpin-helix protein